MIANRIEILRFAEKMANKKTFIINLSRPTKSAEISCSDGEVLVYHNIPSLDSQDEDNSSAGSDSGNTGSSEEKLSYSVDKTPGGTMLPAESQLIAIHRPETLHSGVIYIGLGCNGALSATLSSGAGASPVNIAVWPESELGELREAHPYGDIVTLIGSRGMGWLIYDSNAGTYSFADCLPEPFALEFTMKPEVLPGYMNSSASLPELSVTIEVKRQTPLTETAWGDWIERGISGGIPAESREKVLTAVGAAVERYRKAVEEAGLYLAPVCATGALSEKISSETSVVMPPQMQKPDFIVESWQWFSETLYLRGRFTMVPMRLSASWRRGKNYSPWRSIFTGLTIYAGKEGEFMAEGRGASAAGIRDYTYSDGTSGRAFYFKFRTEAELKAIVSRTNKFNRLADVNVSESISGVILICNVAGFDEIGSFSPDGKLLAVISPRGGAVTDSGVILYGGSMRIRDENGENCEISLENKILSPSADCSVVYPEICRVSDSPVRGVSQGSRSRGASEAARCPLLVFSADGIRTVLSDSTGRYYASQLESRFSVSADFEVMAVPDGTVFMTNGRLRKIPFSSKIQTLLDALPDGVDKMYYEETCGMLILRGPGTTWLYDEDREKKVLLEELSLPRLVSFEGRLYCVDGTGDVCALSIRVNVENAETVGNARRINNTVSTRSEGNSGSDRCGYITRALKLGDAFGCKRVWRVESPGCGVMLTLEGSDDLTEWHIVARGVSPLGGIRAPAFRYWRVTAQADASENGSLTLLRIIAIMLKNH